MDDNSRTLKYKWAMQGGTITVTSDGTLVHNTQMPHIPEASYKFHASMNALLELQSAARERYTGDAAGMWAFIRSSFNAWSGPHGYAPSQQLSVPPAQQNKLAIAALKNIKAALVTAQINSYWAKGDQAQIHQARMIQYTYNEAVERFSKEAAKYNVYLAKDHGGACAKPGDLRDQAAARVGQVHAANVRAIDEMINVLSTP